MKRNTSIDYSNLDWIVISLTLFCTVFGIVIISSAVNTMSGGTKYIIIQSVAAIVGICAMAIFAAIDYEDLGDLSKFIYGLCIVSLVMVLIIGIGRESTGSKSWIRFGPIGIQPSEFVKIGFIITFSAHVASMKDDINRPANVLKLLIHAGILIFLILLQPDYGTALVFICIMAGILFAANISWKYIAGAGGLMAAILPIIWFFFLNETRKNRILVFLSPESDPSGAGYHVLQSKLTIGSGQIFGKGLFHGTQTQLGYLPVKHTDFIFGVIGEELGIIGCIFVTTLLFALIFRILTNSRTAKNDFGSYICIGVAFMLIAHVFENIGMCIGLMPVTGIPLPFFSYGGSSLLTNLMSIGLVLSVYMRRKVINF
ncbi:MAG: rod shape-determining protein RodA [Clostridia bacterium]|nr:rod shape-determining protein RodA [Clostridia bacterium]